MEEEPDFEALRRGDERDWNLAWAPLWGAALGVVHRTLGSKKHLDAENIAKELLVKEVIPQIAHPRTDSFNKIRSFSDLVNMTKRIAKQRALDAVRKHEVHPTVGEEEVELRGSSDPAVQARESGEMFDKLADSLPPPLPTILRMKFAEGMTHEEIAEKLRMPVGTVLSHVYRARKRLREAIEEGRITLS